jgi:hypothetical protein
MKKSDLQWQFVQCQGLFIQYALMKGYKLTEGRGAVSVAANAADGGHENSCHLHRLAKDWNLFVDGKYITGDHPAWHDLGSYWRSLHPLARWGGDFSNKDYNHISFEWQGVR